MPLTTFQDFEETSRLTKQLELAPSDEVISVIPSISDPYENHSAGSIPKPSAGTTEDMDDHIVHGDISPKVALMLSASVEALSPRGSMVEIQRISTTDSPEKLKAALSESPPSLSLTQKPLVAMFSLLGGFLENAKRLYSQKTPSDRKSNKRKREITTSQSKRSNSFPMPETVSRPQKIAITKSIPNRAE